MWRLAAFVTLLIVVVGSHADDHLTRGHPPSSQVAVKAEIWIQDLIELNTDRNELTLILFANYIWDDPALAFEGTEKKILTPEEASKLWNPQINFINARDFEIMHGPDPHVFTMLQPNGTVWSNVRAKVTIPCGSYHSGSLDCRVTIESYNYNADQVDLRWTEQPIIFLQGGGLEHWTLKSMDTAAETVLYPAGKWVEATMKLSFGKRS